MGRAEDIAVFLLIGVLSDVNRTNTGQVTHTKIRLTGLHMKHTIAKA